MQRAGRRLLLKMALRLGQYRCSESVMRPGLARLTTLLLAVLCATPLFFEPAMARKRTKSRPTSVDQQRQSPDGGGGTAPAPLITAVSPGTSGGAALHHLFATPLYVSDLSSSVDSAALSALAREGYSIVVQSTSVQRAMIDLKLSTMPAAEQASPQIVAQLSDDSVFTHNDKFFYYQMANAARCAAEALPACGGVRWDSYFASSARQQLEAAIANAVPQYFASVGVSQSELPPYTVKMWASVMAPGASHTEHEHSSAGECLASGVFYAAAPAGSGALRFRDHRQHLESHPVAFPTTAGYDLQPSSGQLVMFPPWLLHRVLPSQYEEQAEEQQGQHPLRVSWAFNVMVNSAASGSVGEANDKAGLNEAVAAQEDMLDGLLDEL